jgi:hypothetical protein
LKHKILISLDHGSNGPELLKEIKTLLNSSHSKILTGISLSNYLENKLTLVKSESQKVGSVTNEVLVDFEIELEQAADQLGMEFKMLKKNIDDNTLGALSSVADLLIVDRKVLASYCGENVLADLIKVVSCPVLILPINQKIENLLMAHDGSHSSVQAVKHFITIFNQDLRALPVSVLTSDPKSKREIESEKIFIDYVKLFFNNIGIQLMTDEPLKCMIKNIEDSSNNSMIVVGENIGGDMLNCNAQTRVIVDNSPTFIFKNSSI